MDNDTVVILLTSEHSATLTKCRMRYRSMLKLTFGKYRRQRWRAFKASGVASLEYVCCTVTKCGMRISGIIPSGNSRYLVETQMMSESNINNYTSVCTFSPRTNTPETTPIHQQFILFPGCACSFGDSEKCFSVQYISRII